MPALPFLIFVVFWLLIYRPQQLQRRTHQDTVRSLAVGMEVMTVGGLIGLVAELDSETVKIDIGDGTLLTFGRTFIRQQVDTSNDDQQDRPSTQPQAGVTQPDDDADASEAGDPR